MFDSLGGSERSIEDAQSALVGAADQMAAAVCRGDCELEGGPAPEVARRPSCDAVVVTLVEDDEGRPLWVGRKTRTVPPALQRALRARDRGCRFPGCSQRRFVEGHHIQHWAAGGETSLDNLVQLCWFHHCLLHEGGYRLEKESGGGLGFFRPNGTAIVTDPSKGSPARRQARL